jgi:hypothetical protein
MIPFNRIPAALVAAAVLVSFPSAATAQQARALPAPDATYDEPFSAVSGLRELSNGRVVVADARDKVVQLIDLAAQSATKIGREGSGPGEYGLPLRLFGAQRDTSMLYDPLNQRYVTIAPDGKPVGEFRTEVAPPPRPAGDAPVTRQAGAPQGGPAAFSLNIGIPAAVDARGRLYFESAGFSRGADGAPVSADSAVITRFDRATKKLDSLAWVKLPKANTQISGSQGNVRMVVGGANPLAIRDQWAVFPDGRLAIVRGADYHVDWILPNGARTSSAPIMYTPLRFTDADRKEEEARRNAARGNQMMITMDAGAGGTRRSAQMGPGPNAPPLEPLDNWPEVKPPFRPGQGAVWARPNGELWVRRMEPAGAKGTLYDVITFAGAVSHQVRVPDRTNLVGFGNGTVYTTKADEDDLLYLQRHRM